jgi:GntR family transcriptional regulator
VRVAGSIGPSYRLVADDIAKKITAGEWQVGGPIPSTAKLMELYGVSSTVVRQAVAQLREADVLIGHSGKAVYVKARPEDAAAGRLTLEALGGQVAELRAEVRELAQRVGSVDELRDVLGRVEAQLIDLHGKLGYEYPKGGGDANAGGKAARSVRHG